MSGERRQPFVHPFLFFLVNQGVVKTHEFLSGCGTGERHDAAENLIWFLAWFEKDLKEKMKEEIETLKQYVGARWSEEHENLWKSISGVANELHEKKYFDSAKGYFGIDLGEEAKKL